MSGLFLCYATYMAAQMLWCSILGFLVGVLVRSFVPFGWSSIAFVAVLGVCGFVGGLVGARRNHVVLLCGLAFVFFALGAARMHMSVRIAPPVLNPFIDKEITLTGIVVAAPDRRESSARVSVRTSSFSYNDGEEKDVRTGVLAVVPPHTEVSYGEKVTLKGLLRVPSAFDTGAGREFNYSLFLAKDGILYELAHANIVAHEDRHTSVETVLSYPTHVALFIKDSYIDGMRATLPEPHASLAAGITAGEKRGVGKKLSDVFRAVGLTHILVLSGYNIAIVAETIRRMLWRLPRVVRALCVGAGVILLVFASGLQASAVRAGAMGLFAVYARESGRIFFSARILAFVCAVMVLWNPFVLAYDPGFQLSVLATLGLIVGTPLVEPLLTRVPTRFGIREILAATLATQTAVLPLLLYQNGAITVYALFANMSALIVVPFAMLMSFFSALIGIVFGSWGAVFGLPAYILLSYIIGVAEFWSRMPYALLQMPVFGGWLLLIVYICLGIFVWIWHAKKKAAGLPYCSPAASAQ